MKKKKKGMNMFCLKLMFQRLQLRPEGRKIDNNRVEQKELINHFRWSWWLPLTVFFLIVNYHILIYLF